MGMLVYFVLIMAVPLFIQWYLMSTYKKYKKVDASSGMTGADAARKVLDENGLYHVTVEMVPGKLTDHYDPTSKTVRLSEDNYNGTSIAAVSVALHEIGHVLQHQEGMVALKLRSSLVPLANIGSNASFFLILIGILLTSQSMLLLGIIAMSFAVLFQVVTLPVEFNASSRARDLMISSGFITSNEEHGAKKVLNAAALTYVASAVIAIIELLRFVLMFFGMNNEE